MTVPHIAFVGFSGAGKTTLVSLVIAQLKQKGYRIGVLKHTSHDDFQADAAGKDTFKYSEAGADIVAIASNTKFNMLEFRSPAISLTEALQRFVGVDLVIIEGYKQENVDKILVARTSEQLSLRSDISGLIAIATNLSRAAEVNASSLPFIPVLNIDKSEEMTHFVENWYLKQMN